MTQYSEVTDWHAVNPVGRVLATFSTADLARAWVRRNRDVFPGAFVEEVVRTERRRRIFVERLRRVA